MNTTPPPPVADALLAELFARVEQQDERIRRIDAVLRALARLPEDSQRGPAAPTTETKRLSTVADATPPIIRWPTRVRADSRLAPADTDDGVLRATAAGAGPGPVVATDEGGIVRVWNAAAAHLFGWAPHEVLGSPPMFLPDDKTFEHAELARGTLAAPPDRALATVRKRKDGGLVLVRVAVVPSRCGGAVFVFRQQAETTLDCAPPLPPDPAPAAPPAAATYRPPADDRRATPEAPVRDPLAAGANGFVTLGRAVAGVAHDFNNMLSVIQGYAELLAEQLPPGTDQRAAAETIVATADAAGGVVRHLMAVTRPELGTPPRTDPNLLFVRLDRLIRAIVGARVKVVVAPAADPGLVKIAPAEFTQIVLNLTTNARDAMPDGGTLTVRTAAQIVSPGRPGWPARMPPGAFVVLTVGDTGAGMDEATRLRACDPFFTTKAAAGTGIGLATVRDIVTRAGGHLELDSEPGWGTQVRVYLPKA